MISVTQTVTRAADDIAPLGKNPTAALTVPQAVANLAQSPSWRHLDATWIDAVHSVKMVGPPIHVDVNVVTSDGQPVANAVVVIQESISEARFRAGLIAEPFQSVRAISVTDGDGNCRFDSVTMTPPALGKHGRIMACVAVAHPAFGFDLYPLLRTSREQTAKVVMHSQVALPVVVQPVGVQPVVAQNGNLPSEWRISGFDRSREPRAGFRRFIADPFFSPRAVFDARGRAEFKSLPKGTLVNLEVRDQDGWRDSGLTSPIPIDSKPVMVDLNAPPLRVPIRFIDSRTRRPISQVAIDRWRHGEQLSDEDGLVLIKPAFSYSAFRLRRIVNLSFTIEPPSDWVREDIGQYPYRAGSAPGSFRLTLATAIHGRVVDAMGGDGIAGVLVQSLSPHPMSGGVTGQFHPTAVTDEDGAFTLSAPPGRQSVSIAAPVSGYLLPPEQRVSVVMGRPGKKLTIEMRPADPIVGRVVDSDGKVVTGAEVVCHANESMWRYRGGLPLDATIVTATTNDAGEFKIVRPAGEYNSLRIKSFAGGRQSRDAVIDFDPASNRQADVDLELSLGEKPRSIEIVGTVLRDGKPWSGINVTADPPPSRLQNGVSSRFSHRARGSAELGETTTNAEGRYRLVVDVHDHESLSLGVNLPRSFGPARHRLVPLNSSRIELPPFNITQKVGNKSIRGIVVDPRGDPVVGIVVEANRQPSSRPQASSPTGRRTRKQTPHSATTDANGRFELRQLMDGPVSIRVWPKGVPRQYSVCSEVSIPAGETNTRIVLDPSLSRLPVLIEPVAHAPLSQLGRPMNAQPKGKGAGAETKIRGIVVDQAGAPVDRATVRVFSVSPTQSAGYNNPLHHPSRLLSAKANSQGQFEIGPFPVGNKVRIAAGANGLSAQVSAPLSMDGRDVFVEIKLRRYNPDLPALKTTHQLIDSLGGPVSGAIIATTYRDSPNVVEFSSGEGPTVMTDDRGNFRFPTVSGVDYVTVAAFPVDGPASVIRNDYSRRTYRLADPMSIRGRVVTESGQPIEGFHIFVRAASLPGRIQVLSRSDGTFQIDALPSGGSYFLIGAAGANASHASFHWPLRQFESKHGSVIDLGDLTAKPPAQLIVKVVPPKGKTIPESVSVQLGRQRVQLSSEGLASFPAITASTPTLRIDGPVVVDRTDPPLQVIWGSTYGVNTDNTSTITVHLK